MATPDRHKYESMELEKWKVSRGFERKLQEAHAEVSTVSICLTFRDNEDLRLMSLVCLDI